MRQQVVLGCIAAYCAACGGTEGPDRRQAADAAGGAAGRASSEGGGAGGSAGDGSGGAGAASAGATATGGAGASGGGSGGAGGATWLDGGAGVPGGQGGEVLDAGTGRSTTIPDASIDPPLVLTNQVDLLMVIDNSISMADKQELLVSAVPDFVRQLVNPDCVDPATGVRSAPPDDAMAACPAPTVRTFAPVTDLHLGIVTSSLGSIGTFLCSESEEQDDRGRLLGGRPRALDLGLASGVDGTPGFMAWAPGSATSEFVDVAQSMVSRAGELGCGYEATLEAWYRFLVDPAPAESIAIEPCVDGGAAQCARPVGIDAALLAQRAEFLRPESALVVVMLTDENDCSIRADGQAFLVAENVSLPRGATICAQNPNDPCCYPCDLDPPPGCDPDPTCTTSPTVPGAEDGLNHRCFHQKQRFGRDFLYPVERYARALTSRTLCQGHADLDPNGCPEPAVPNPLYSGAASERSEDLIVLMGIIGVPWEDLQTTTSPTGTLYPAEELHFQTPAQMRASGTWARILGDPGASPPVVPTDPLMIESIEPRTGVNPVTGDALEPISAGYLANPINGHEWVAGWEDDLQFSCIMPLATPRNCSDPIYDTLGCDCRSDVDVSLNPVCQSPDGSYSTTQRFAKAYPGLRHLHVLEQLGDRGVVASICARNIDDPTRQDFGYGPATDGLMNRLSLILR